MARHSLEGRHTDKPQDNIIICVTMYVMFISQHRMLFCHAATVVFLTAAAPVVAKTPAQGLSSNAIKAVIEESDSLEKDYKQKVYASYANGIASVSLFRHPEATRADCKIDAVLMARKIIKLSPKQVRLVRCVFYDYDRQNEFWEVEVRAQLVAAFAQGKIGEQDLINSILLTEDKQKNPLSEKFAMLSYSGILDFDSVCKGACEERRLAIHLRLEELEKQKVELGHFREDFLRIEDAARRGQDKDLQNNISQLNKSLDQYVEEMINSGQMQKPEIRRAKNTIGTDRTPKI